MVRSMLKWKNLPNEFWAEAALCVVYILNRSPTRNLSGMTPLEAWSGRKSTVAHFRVFGLLAYAQIPIQNRRKLDDRSVKCIFIGYDTASKGYKLYNPTSKRVFSSRDVVVDEESQWAWSVEEMKTATTGNANQSSSWMQNIEEQEDAVIEAPLTAEQQSQQQDNGSQQTASTGHSNESHSYPDETTSPGSEGSPTNQPRMRSPQKIYEEAYIRKILDKFGIKGSKVVSTPVSCGESLSKQSPGKRINATEFRTLVGSLRYVTCTRPDILYGVGMISRFMEAPTEQHWLAGNRILRYLSGTLGMGLWYTRSNDFSLKGFSDSDWGGCVDDRKSTTWFVFFIGNSAFCWISKKQPIVTLSTCEAEYVAAAACTCHAVWLRYVLKTLHLEQDSPTEVLIDNQSAIALAKNPIHHERSKHIDTKYHYIQECTANGWITPTYIPSRDQAADIFTKPLKHDVFQSLRRFLCISRKDFDAY